MSTLTHAAATPSPAQILAATQAFLAAHEAAEELRDTLTPAQCAGVDPEPAGLEYLDGEARARCEALTALTGLDDMFGDLACLYTRRRVPVGAPTSTSGSTWGRVA